MVFQLPWFALAYPYVTSNATIADLYSHRSGFPDHTGSKLEDLGYDWCQAIEHMRCLTLLIFQIPVAYNSFSFTVAA
ncbi:hypothetical protein [Mycobacterium uberis]|uniref:hypothetical protein n=1 Tax=Mycobacterium uberis TaxID=2162698 RepID=UPI000E303A4B|nr:hypothetical protein [Mycobacterium uberis]